MLKTLRVTSFVTVILAAIGVITIVALGLRGDPQIKAFLAKQGIIDELRGKASQGDAKGDKSSPLVALARAFALRIDPPPPPKPPVDKTKPKAPAETARVKPKAPVAVKPKVQTVKSDLLATVMYKTAPEKSLALLKTTGNKQEWFRQGEKVGHLEIHEIRDGSVVFTQGGKNPQERFVPAKPQVKSLLKNSGQVSRTGPGSITTQTPASGQAQTEKPGAASAPKKSAVTNSGKVRLVRPSSSRADVSERIRNARSIPSPASPQEQKKSLNKTMSGIEAIMKRQDDAASGEDRKKENEMWMRLLKEINAEKERLDAEQPRAERPKEKTEKKPQGAGQPVPADPNKP